MNDENFEIIDWAKMDFMGLIEIPRVDNVRLEYQQFSEMASSNQLKNEVVEGSICLTSHHLIFSPKQPSEKNKEIWLLNALIDLLELKIRETRYQILIKCKDFRVFLIDFPSIYHCQGVHKSLEALSNITSDNMKIAFFNALGSKINPYDWVLYRVEDDFDRYFGPGSSKLDESNSDWRISYVNKNFSVCASYPPKLIVPKNVDDATLIKSSQFRAQGRFPVLSFYHPKSKGFLLRSSQPLLGTSNRRCKEDETLLKTCLPAQKKGLIFDLRDSSVLKTAQSRGGGYETDSNYPLWKRINKHLDRYDQLQTSFTRLVDTFVPSNGSTDSSSFLSRLEASTWLYNMRQCLHVACTIADEMLNRNACVLVHGNDGWDNTLVVCALVQIVINPEARTISGFELLIEREWLHAGHMFSKRCAKSAFGSTSHKQEAPVFLLFLDCVRQLLEQFCLSFEFNQEFLIALFDNIYASEYGTFLGNCQKEREQLQLATRTASLWTYFNSPENLKQFQNPLYEPNENVIWPSLYSQSISVWTSLFLRHQRNDKPQKEVSTELEKMVEANKLAREKVDRLRKEMVELQKEAITRGLISSQN